MENTVVFRAEIAYTALPMSTTADDIAEHISNWVHTGSATIGVQGTRLDVDSTCPTELESFDSLDCDAEEQPQTGEARDGGSSDDTVVIVAGILGVVCVLVIITSIFIASILVRKRQKQKRLAADISSKYCNGNSISASLYIQV